MSDAPTAISMVPYFTSHTIGTSISNEKIWFDAHNYDPITNLLINIVENPGLSNFRSKLNKLHSVHRQPTRLGNLPLEHGVLYRKEGFKYDIKHVNLRFVSESVHNVIFVTVHANPISGHHDAFSKFRKICQHYLWPGIYQ